MRRIAGRLKDVLESGPVTFLVGVALVVTSAFELVDSDLQHALGIEIGARHGVLGWGLVQLFRGLGAIVGDVKDLREGVEDLAGTPSRGK